MNDIKNDKNLREAVSRKEQKLPPMPADLNERLQQRLSSPEGTRIRRGRGVRLLLLLAAAASIALLVVFYTGKQQPPQEPVVAQQVVKSEVAPSQPIVEESQPEVVSKEQSEEKPITELNEDAPQATEPTSTENEKVPRHFSAHPIQDITLTEDEPFFLASTSYMATHRSLADHLAPDDSDDDGLNLYAAKDKDGMPEGWTDLRSNDQKSRRKLTKKERQQVAVVDAIAAKRWHIDINTMSTMRYGSKTVTPDFYLELRGDTLRSYLPYLGQVHVSSTLSPSIGLNFEEPVLTYKESKPKSNKYTQIDIDVKTKEDSYHYVIELYGNGQAYIRVRSMYRDPISFDGTLEVE